MHEIYGSSYDSGDDSRDAAIGGNRSGRSADETGKGTCAGDAEPLSREERADLMRPGPADEGHDDGDDGLPTRQESWDYTWGEKAGERPPWADEDDAMMAEYDKQAEAFLAAEEEGLPTRQEAWEQTWGDSPEYWDEATQTWRALDGTADRSEATDVDATPGQHHDANAISRDNGHLPERGDDSQYYPEAGLADVEPDALTARNDRPATKGAETLDAGSASQSPDLHGEAEPGITGHADAGDDTDGHGEEDKPQHGDADADIRSDTEQIPSPEQERISVLEAEYADVRQRLADAEHQIADVKASSEARMDHFEQLLTNIGQHPGDISTPEHGVDKPASTADAESPRDTLSRDHDTRISERKSGEDRADAGYGKSRSPRWRSIASVENAGIASTLFGTADTVYQFADHPTTIGTLGLASLGFGLVSLAGTQYNKRKRRQ